MDKFFETLNIKKYCEEYKVGLWECPPFVFLVMGVIIVVSIIATYLVGSLYAEPMIVALIIFVVTVVLLILSYIVMKSFEKMAFLSKEKSEFISIMSHQLRTPLSSIKWQLDTLLRKGVSVSGESGQESLLAVEEQNDRMIRLINDMLEINRFENDSLVFETANFSLTDLIQEMVDKYKSKSEYSKFEVLFSREDGDIQVHADKLRMGVVISHLLDNSIRYSPDGGKISIFLEKLPNKARFSISDEGVGIPKKDMAEIFTKFYRGSLSRKYKSDGLGIGLYVAKSIIESFGGNMDFSSIEGKGSTFWFTIPTKLSDK
ncbi:sensor histidine kinase [Patescibacteria group bacterium]